MPARRRARWLPAAALAFAAALAPAAGQDDARPGGEAYEDPFAAYEAGAWDEALRGFENLQVERPGDLGVALNRGAVQFRREAFAEADRAFAEAARADDPELREHALYNLGNSAFRQGRLDEAETYYRAALELDPSDRDAKFNLELTQAEKQRRAQQQQAPQQPQDGQETGDSEQPEPSPDAGEQDQEGEGGDPRQEAGSEPQQPEEPQRDGDGDGLPDRTEREGENPTDPENPDTDGDGLSDGEEDRDRDGAVDPGETDPNLADSDGDGIPDGAEAPGEAAGEAAGAEARELSPEEAARYLSALEEGRAPAHRGRGRRVRSEKDW